MFYTDAGQFGDQTTENVAPYLKCRTDQSEVTPLYL